MKNKVLVSLFIAVFCVSLHGMKRKTISQEKESSDAATKQLIEFCNSRSLAPARALLDAGADVDCEALDIAASIGDITMIVELLKRGVDVNSVCAPRYKAPLHYAAENGHQETCEFLMNRGADIEALSKSGLTPLHLAAASGNMEVCKLLINKQAKVINDGATPLHCAAIKGHKEICKFFLTEDEDVDVNSVGISKMTPLHWAALYGHTDVCEFLIEKGADIKAESIIGDTPLHCAAYMGQKAAFKLLISKNADIKAQNKNGEAPLDKALKNCHTFLKDTHIDSENDDESELVSQEEASEEESPENDVQDIDLDNHLNAATRSLIAFCKFRALTAAQVLLDAGADVHCQALHIAAADGDISMIVELLKRGANVNTVSGPRKWTPLHYAVENGHEETCEFLMNRGADIEAFSKNGFTPLDLAAAKGNMGICKLFVREHPKVVTNGWSTPLHCAATKGHEDICKFFLTEEVNVNSIGKSRMTPLHCAASAGQEIICKILISCGADKQAENNKGKIPLNLALKNGHTYLKDLISPKKNDLKRVFIGVIEEKDRLSSSSNNNDEKKKLIKKSY